MSEELKVGRKLDAWIQRRLFNMTVERRGEHYRFYNETLREQYGGRWTSPVPEYSTDIKAAWEVVKHMAARGLWLTLLTPYDAVDNYHATFTPHGKPEWCNALAKARADTAPLAICLAALKTVSRVTARDSGVSLVGSVLHHP
jgi:hypothetical protein